jgi:RNA 2',3'-cyclic 3'-phosphodiesterase
VNDERIRAFIAVPVPEVVRERLADEQDRLRPLLPKASWARPAGSHLTLHFLGDVSPGLTRRLGDELAAACAPLAPFGVDVRGFGLFPGATRPRVLWVGVSAKESLAAVHRVCRGVLTRRKLKVERRRWHPHLTLARFRQRPSPDGIAALEEVVAEPPSSLGTLPVSEVHLYRSRLDPGGARYDVLARAPLAG